HSRESGNPGRNGSPQRVPATHSASLTAFTPVFDGLWTRVNALLLSRGAPRGDERIHPTALSTLPPAVTGLAATTTNAMTQGALPLFTQLWMGPRCTSTPPPFRWPLGPAASMSISPHNTVA